MNALDMTFKRCRIHNHHASVFTGAVDAFEPFDNAEVVPSLDPEVIPGQEVLCVAGEACRCGDDAFGGVLVPVLEHPIELLDGRSPYFVRWRVAFALDQQTDVRLRPFCRADVKAAVPCFGRDGDVVPEAFKEVRNDLFERSRRELVKVVGVLGKSAQDTREIDSDDPLWLEVAGYCCVRRREGAKPKKEFKKPAFRRGVDEVRYDDVREGVEMVAEELCEVGGAILVAEHAPEDGRPEAFF